MAKHLNRCLLSWEVVHHKDGIKDDNRLENLQLFPHNNYQQPDMQLKARIKQLEQQLQTEHKAGMKEVLSYLNYKREGGYNFCVKIGWDEWESKLKEWAIEK